MSWGTLSGSDGEASPHSPRGPPRPRLPAPPALAGPLPGRERLAYANVFMTCFVTKTISGPAGQHGLQYHRALPGRRGRGEPWRRVGPARPSNPRTPPGSIVHDKKSLICHDKRKRFMASTGGERSLSNYLLCR